MTFADAAAEYLRYIQDGKFPQRSSGDIQVFSPEEVGALVRARAATTSTGQRCAANHSSDTESPRERFHT